jgi:spoIIIJ-associated protein
VTESKTDRGQQWLQELLNLAGFSTTVSGQAPDNEHQLNHWLTIDDRALTSAQVDTLIGPEGVNIDAIQYLANASLNFHQDRDSQAGYIVELNGYRLRRAAELKVLADYAAERVRQTALEFVMQPMSSAERRQLHTFFETDPSYRDLETSSRGQEPDRRMVVRLAGTGDDFDRF